MLCYELLCNVISILDFRKTGVILKHFRGQESAGIVTSLGSADSKFKKKKGMGLVTHIYNEEDLGKLKGNLGIGE